MTVAFLPMAAPPASAGSGWCASSPPTATCIESVERDGSPVTESDPTYSLDLVESPGWQVSVTVRRGFTFDLTGAELGHTWRITLNTRGNVPRVLFTRSTRGPVSRVKDGSGEYHITFAGTPVTVTGGCDGAGVCPATATSSMVTLDATVYDADGWYAGDGTPLAAWMGSNVWTNIDWTSFPPSVSNGVLQVPVANSHFLPGGVTPVSGFIEQDLPYSLVRTALFVDDPYSLVGAAMVATVSGSGAGTVSVVPDDANRVLQVSATGLSFSRRTISVRRGVTTPKAGVVVGATRKASSPTTVRVAYKRGVARGSAIIGYQARCYRVVGGERVSVRYGSVRSFVGIAVTQVSQRSGQRCQVRVRSKAGYGPWSAPVAVTS